MKIKSGFTLIEMIVAVAIVGILASLAFPSYLNHIQKSRRIDVEQKLLYTAAKLERIYTRNGGYPDSFNSLPESEFYWFSYLSTNKPEGAANYRSRGFVLTAIPNQTTSQKTERCGRLTLNQQSKQGADDDNCW